MFGALAGSFCFINDLRSSANIAFNVKPNTVDPNNLAFESLNGNIDPGENGNMEASGFWMWSTEGLIGLGIPNSKWKVVVYWNVPYGPKLIVSANKLAIGFVKTEKASYLKTLDTSSSRLESKGFEIGEYRKGGVALVKCQEEICIRGTMGTSTKGKISITIYRKGTN